MNVNKFNWVTGTVDIDREFDKQKLINDYVRYFLVRSQEIFEYTNLPDSIPKNDLEMILQINGVGCVTKIDGKLYALTGGLGGELNAYFKPTIMVVSNPYLNYSKDLEIGKDCVLIKNDAYNVGLMPMFNKYAILLAETDISLKMATINSRMPKLLQSDNDKAYQSAKQILLDLINGQMGIIGSTVTFDGVKSIDFDTGKTGNIKELIELKQYLMSNWYIELGLNANFNMKREAINSAESGMNESTLLPLIDQMLYQRQMALDNINIKYGTNITVDYSSAWKLIHDEIVQSTDATGGDNNEIKSGE